MTNAKERFEYFISKESVVRNQYCFNCNEVINPRSKFIHVNIYNNPSVKFFCSKECKNQWIYKMSKPKT